MRQSSDDDSVAVRLAAETLDDGLLGRQRLRRILHPDVELNSGAAALVRQEPPATGFASVIWRRVSTSSVIAMTLSSRIAVLASTSAPACPRA
jgi:hypothetical protein